MLHTMETSSKAVGTLPSLSERLKVRQTNNVHVSITMSVIKKKYYLQHRHSQLHDVRHC